MGIDKDGFLVGSVMGQEYKEWANGLLRKVKELEEKISVLSGFAFARGRVPPQQEEEWIITDGENLLGFLRFWPGSGLVNNSIVFKNQEAAEEVASAITETLQVDNLEEVIRVMRVEEFEKLPQNQPIKGGKKGLR